MVHVPKFSTKRRGELGPDSERRCGPFRKSIPPFAPIPEPMMATLKTVNKADRDRVVFRTNFVVKPLSLVSDGGMEFPTGTFHPLPLYSVIPQPALPLDPHY